MADETKKRAPTPGLRLERLEDGSIALVMGAKLAPYIANDDQVETDLEYMNWLLETDERRQEKLASIQGTQRDLLVDLGDMTRANLDSIKMDATYESMTEDFLETFNNIVLQGIPPITAVFSLSQAFAIVLGYALRANMPFDIAKSLITQVMKSATAAEQMVRVITQHRSGNA